MSAAMEGATTPTARSSAATIEFDHVSKRYDAAAIKEIDGIAITTLNATAKSPAAPLKIHPGRIERFRQCPGE